jgi:hypothetical protein
MPRGMSSGTPFYMEYLCRAKEKKEDYIHILTKSMMGQLTIPYTPGFLMITS